MDEQATLTAWLSRVADELGIPASAVADPKPLLDVARDVAHNVVRPAAPLTTYAVGVAVGLAVAAGLDPAEALSQYASAASDLALDGA